MIINTRFDVLSNSFSFNESILLGLIIKNVNTIFTKNIFLKDTYFSGIDNFYIGNINTMYKLINHFHYNLDEILIRNKILNGQEHLVYLENNYLF